MSCTDTPISNPNKRKREFNGDASSSLPQDPVEGKRQRLHIEIPTSPPRGVIPSSTAGLDDDEVIISGLSEPNSLFDSPSDSLGLSTAPSSTLGDSLSSKSQLPASLIAPPIPGLFFDPSMRISRELSEEVVQYCMATYFRDQNVNQVMLFERAPEQPSPDLDSADAQNRSLAPFTGLPPVLLKLLSDLDPELDAVLPKKTHALLFPRSDAAVPSPNLGRARQAIINLYHPGEGITPHVDLLKRFGDGIIGTSFGSGCVMQFAEAKQSAGKDICVSETTSETNSQGLYLPERSVIVLSEDARYLWTHGIPKQREDLVALAQPEPGQTIDHVEDTTQSEWIPRGTRLSVTFRWLLPGAEVVGGD